MDKTNNKLAFQFEIYQTMTFFRKIIDNNDQRQEISHHRRSIQHAAGISDQPGCSL